MSRRFNKKICVVSSSHFINKITELISNRTISTNANSNYNSLSFRLVMRVNYE